MVLSLAVPLPHTVTVIFQDTSSDVHAYCAPLMWSFLFTSDFHSEFFAQGQRTRDYVRAWRFGTFVFVGTVGSQANLAEAIKYSVIYLPGSKLSRST